MVEGCVVLEVLESVVREVVSVALEVVTSRSLEVLNVLVTRLAEDDVESGTAPEMGSTPLPAGGDLASSPAAADELDESLNLSFAVLDGERVDDPPSQVHSSEARGIGSSAQCLTSTQSPSTLQLTARERTQPVSAGRQGLHGSEFQLGAAGASLLAWLLGAGVGATSAGERSACSNSLLIAGEGATGRPFAPPAPGLLFFLCKPLSMVVESTGEPRMARVSIASRTSVPCLPVAGLPSAAS